MKRATEVCVLPDGRRVKYALKRRARDPFYLVRFVGQEGRRLEKTTGQASLKRARDMAATVINEEYNPKATTTLVPWERTIELFLAAMKAQNLRQPTINDYLLAIRNLRKVHPASRGPADITPELAKEYKRVRKAKVAIFTLAGNINKLSVIWSKWFIGECKVVSTNPWDEVEMPKVDKLEPRYISPDEHAAFFAWLKERWDGWRLPILFFTVKSLVGCRITELCFLPTDNLKEGRIKFDAETTKSRKARRPKLPEDVFKELVTLAGRKFAWERYSEQLRAINKARKAKGFVKEFTPARLRRFLQNEIIEYRQANKDDPAFRSFTAHDFRGTAMSKAVTAGATLDQASLAFGCHPETMKRHYLTLQEQDIADGVFDRIQTNANGQPKQEPPAHPDGASGNGKG